MQETLAGNGLPFMYSNDPILIIGGVSHTIDTAYRGYHDDIPSAA